MESIKEIDDGKLPHGNGFFVWNFDHHAIL